LTFALLAANADQIIQVSDRRLTGWDGTVRTEASGKAGHLLCDDASVLYCFTGLATINGFKTSTWLMESLQAASRKDSRFLELIEHFAQLATEHFWSNPDVLSVHAQHRRLTVMLSGYTVDGFIVNALISNFQDFVKFVDHSAAQSQFTVYCEQTGTPASENPTIIQAVGAFDALTEADERELRRMLEKRAPHAAIRAKTAAIVAEISDRHRSAGTVGKRLNTGRIDYLSPMVASAGYESDIVEQLIPMLDMVDARTTSAGLFWPIDRSTPTSCGRACRLPRGASERALPVREREAVQILPPTQQAVACD
jgi:hypothetical protein